MVEGGIPEGNDTGWSNGIGNQALLQVPHQKIRGNVIAFKGKGRSRTRGLTNVENQRLQARGTVCHMGAAEGLVGGQKIVEIGTQEGLVGHTKRRAAPAPTPAAALGSQGPVIPWVVVVIGVIANGNGTDLSLSIAGQS